MYSNIIYRRITCWCEVPNPAGQHTVSTCTEHVLWVTGKTDVRRSASFVMMCRNTQCTILWMQKTYFNVVTEQRDKNTSKWSMVGDQSQRRWNPRDLWRVTWQTNTGRTAQHECKSQTARARIVRNRRSPSGSCNFAVFEKFTRTYWRNKKRAQCIVELYKHARIFKNTREVQRSTSILKNSQVLITQQCSRNEIFYFFYNMYREFRALVPMT